MQSVCSSDIKLRPFALLVQLMDMRTTSNSEKKLELPENWNYYYYYYYYHHHHHHHRHHNHHHHHLQCIRPSLWPIQPLFSGYGRFISRDKAAGAWEWSYTPSSGKVENARSYGQHPLPHLPSGRSQRQFYFLIVRITTTTIIIIISSSSSSTCRSGDGGGGGGSSSSSAIDELYLHVGW